MKKFLKRVSILVGLIALYFLSNYLFEFIDKKLNLPQTIVFELPFTEDTISKYDIQPEDEIEKVYISGFFNDWNPEAENYQMERISSNKWQITMPFEPGENQYKFVIHIKHWDQYLWAYDKNSKIKVDDAFGGYNSVIKIRTTKPIALFFKFIILGFISILLLYIILEPIIRWIMLIKFPIKIKLTMSVFLIGIVSNFAFILYNFYEQRELIKTFMIDNMNIAHNYLTGFGVDFEKLGSDENKTILNNGLNNILWNAKARVEKNKHSNSQLTINAIMIFDTNFNLIAFGDREESRDIYLERARDFGFKDLNDFFQNGILSNIIFEMKKKDAPILETTFGKADDRYQETSNYRKTLLYLGYNIIVHPIIYKNKLSGYYVGYFHPELFGGELMNTLRFNIYLILIVTILLFLLFTNIGDLITEYLKILVEWTKSIVKGDFTMEKTIQSHDEIETLARNFNDMRLSLKENIQQLKLMNIITSTLPGVTELNELYNVFLIFLTANFGFKYNRAAIFIKDEGAIRGKYAIGMLDEDDIKNTFGNMKNYYEFKLDLESFLKNHKEYIENLDSAFTKKIGKLKIDIADLRKDSFFYTILHSGKVILVEKNKKLPGNWEEKLKTELNLNEYALFPVLKEKIVIGVLLLDNYFNKEKITNKHIQLIQILMNDFALNLENVSMIETLERKVTERTKELEQANKLLEYAAATDNLTKLFNRQELQKEILSEEERIKRYHKNEMIKFSVIFIDLDNFKYYNDNFGHPVGDLILRKFASIIKKSVRTVDFPCRYGGDEFIILLPETVASGAITFASRIMNEIIKRKQFQPEIEDFINEKIELPEEYRLSCSIGISGYSTKSGEFNIEKLIEQADFALLEAKQKGKNQYMIWK